MKGAQVIAAGSAFENLENVNRIERHQDEVKEVKEGTECGMAFESYDDIKDGDVIECFEIIEEARKVN